MYVYIYVYIYIHMQGKLIVVPATWKVSLSESTTSVWECTCSDMDLFGKHIVLENASNDEFTSPAFLIKASSTPADVNMDFTFKKVKVLYPVLKKGSHWSKPDEFVIEYPVLVNTKPITPGTELEYAKSVPQAPSAKRSIDVQAVSIKVKKARGD